RHDHALCGCDRSTHHRRDPRRHEARGGVEGRLRQVLVPDDRESRPEGVIHRGGFLYSLVAFLALAVSPEVPAPLKPWVDWVLQDKRPELCPNMHGSSERECAWPGHLELLLDKRQGSFTQRWAIDALAWVPLPGDQKHWPLDVKVDGQGAL